jgi:5'-phosphate synthase pdxT subunit
VSAGIRGGGPRIAVLALQGDFEAHARALGARGAEVVEARTPEELACAQGVVLPGGESTTMLRLMEGNGLAEQLTRLVRGGTPVLATCAGVILLAREVRNPRQLSLALLDVAVERNGYGRQLDSAVVPLRVTDRDQLGTEHLEGVFIRAPRVVATGPAVAVLAKRNGDAVLVRQGPILGATFHPELSEGSPVVDLFVRMAGGET